MARTIHTNNTQAFLLNAITAVQTNIVLQSGQGAQFPEINNLDAEQFWITVEDRSVGALEIMLCTARNVDSLTVTRGQQGTTPKAFVAGTSVANRVTAGYLNEYDSRIDEATEASEAAAEASATALAAAATATAAAEDATEVANSMAGDLAAVDDKADAALVASATATTQAATAYEASQTAAASAANATSIATTAQTSAAAAQTAAVGAALDAAEAAVDAEAAAAAAAKEPEFRKSTTHIQWRLVGDPTWIDLVPLIEITGDDGAPGTKWYPGVVPPSDADGINGDYYHNEFLQTYQIKASGVWGTSHPFGGGGGGSMPTGSTTWNMVVGNTGVNWGYRELAHGHFWETALGTLRVYALVGSAPDLIRYRVQDASNTDVQIPDITSLSVRLTDGAGAFVTIFMNWNDTNNRYEANDVPFYNYLVAHANQTLTVTGLYAEADQVDLAITGTIPTALVEGQSYSSIQMTAAGGDPPRVFSLGGTWPGLTISPTTGLISGTAGAAASYPNCYVKVTDQAGIVAETAKVTIVVAPAPALVLSGTPVLTATQGTDYTGFDVTPAGGNSPYSFALEGAWPTGYSVAKVGNVGQVRGNTSQTGSFPNLNVKVTDALGATDLLQNTAFTLTVAAGAFGAYKGFTSVATGNPVLANTGYAIGDYLLVMAGRIGTGAIPSLVIDAANPWTPLGSVVDGERSLVVYGMEAISTSHTVTWTNAAGYRPAWAFDDKVPDIVKFATAASGSNVPFPEL